MVLLDEVEKAHPAVFDLLLQVCGEARLTDNRGQLANFSDTVIVMTSNLGADTLRPGVGFEGHRALDPEAARAHYLAEARRFFRPELFNRLDEVVVFSALGPGAIEAITRREVGRITAREGLRRRDIALEVDDAAASLLAARGLDPRYGARPLKRTLERELVAPVAAWLADHAQSGPTRMQATAEDGALSLRATALRTRMEGAAPTPRPRSTRPPTCARRCVGGRSPRRRCGCARACGGSRARRGRRRSGRTARSPTRPPGARRRRGRCSTCSTRRGAAPRPARTSRSRPGTGATARP